MFKLIKIITSGKNVPEIMAVRPTHKGAFKAGTLLTCDDGYAVNCTATDKPLYVAAESIAEAETTDLLKVYPITENMIFETSSDGYPSYLNVGEKYTLSIKNGFATGVTTTSEGGVATIVEKMDAAYIGDKILVRFE